MSLLKATPSRAKINHTIDNELYALFTFTPPKMAAVERAPLDLALVLDHSGSMAGEKLDYVRKSCVKLIELLKDTDTVSIVLFESHVTLLAPPTKCTPDGKAELIRRANEVHTAGGTNLSGGLFKGVEFVAGAKEGCVRKCLLFTDGQANEGLVDPDKLTKTALELRQGTGISTFGYGSGYNADLLAKLAQNGGTYFIDTPDKILTAFGTELGGLISTFGQNVEMRLHPGEDVEIEEVLNDLTVDEDGGKSPGTSASTDLIVHCEDLLAEQPYYVAVKLKAKPRANTFPRDVTLVSASVKFMNLAEGKLDECGAKVAVRFVKPGEEDTTDDADVMKQIGVFQVAAAQQQAINMMNVGNYAGAGVYMSEVMHRVVDYSPDAAKIAAGTVALCSEDAYMRGGHQLLRTSAKAMYSNRGGLAGQSLGGVELDCFASPVQSSTAGAFTGTPDVVPAPVVVTQSGVVNPAIIDPASTQARAKVTPPPAKSSKSKSKKRSGKRW